VLVPLIVTLEELYNGAFIDMTRTKRSYREAPGQRDCNCRYVVFTQFFQTIFLA